MTDQKAGLLASIRKYPPAVFFILGNELCERFSFYGMRAVLLLYLLNEHKFSNSKATVVYHSFVALAYLSPLFGSIAADNYFGRYRIIFWISLVYVIGQAILSVGSMSYLSSLPKSLMDFSGLVVIALATGGIKPCVSAFAADQFEESRHKERDQFFAFFYLAINLGSFLSMLVTPLLRSQVQCFGSDYCFPLAFGVPGALMLIAFILFVSGSSFYKIIPTEGGNVIFKVFHCIGIALKAKICALINRTTTLPHWLYYAKVKYNDNVFIAEVKTFVSVCTLFLPLMVCAALFDQTGSTWVIQSLQMNGRVGSLIIQPDQMVTVNSLLVSKVSKVTPLRKMGLACILMVFSFFMAGFLQMVINDSVDALPAPGHVFVQRVGSSTDQFRANVLGKSLSNIKEEWPVGKYVIKSKKVSYNLDLKAEFCGYLVGLFDEDHIPELSSFPYVCNKESNGRTRVYIMLAPASVLNSTNIYLLDQNEQIKQTHQIYSGEFIDIVPSFISSTHYYFAYDNCKLRSKTRVSCKQQHSLQANSGAIHVLTLTQSNVKSSGKDYNTLLVKGNSLSILWQLPQYAMISLAEVLLLITGLSFSYSQAAPSMKSVLQAVWLLMVFFGNFIDMIIMATNIYKNAVFGFFFSAGLMAIAAGIFIVLSMNYTYVEHLLSSNSVKDSQIIEKE